VFRTMFFCGIAIMTVVIDTTGLIFCAGASPRGAKDALPSDSYGQWLSGHSDKALASFTWRMIWITQTDRDSDAHRNDLYN
jgi:hypothetical protein